MGLTYHQAMLVKASFTRARQRMPRASTLFYDTLFAGDPEYKRFFSCDLAEQEIRLFRHLSTVVEMLAYPKIMDARFEALAKLHVEKGISAHDFPAFNAAMVELMGKLLGDAFTSELEVAWRAALADITRRIIAKGRFVQ